MLTTACVCGGRTGARTKGPVCVRFQLRMPLGTLTTRSVSRACAAATLGTPTGVTVGEFGPFIFGRLQSYIYTRNSFPNPPNGGNSRGNSRTVNREGCHSVAAVHERSDERVASVPKGVRSAHTQAALTGARNTPSERADANGRKEDEPPKRCTRLLNVAAARPSIGAVGACAPSELRVHHHVHSTRIRSVIS